PPKTKTTPRSSFLTARVVVFIVLLVVVLGGTVAVIGWYARGAYYVGLNGQQVAIYQGRPGGLLWFQPTLVQRTDVTKDQLTGVRRFAPAADPILLPVAGLLNGVGYVFITRLDRHLAGLQATWTALGIVAFIATLFVIRRVRDLERYRYTFALIGIGLLLLPL